MGIMNLFKKKKSGFEDKVPPFDTDIVYQGVNIWITDNIEESKLHVEEDYAKLTEIGIDKIVREMYLPWLKAEEFKDRDDDKILEGLKIDDITYEYISATGEGRFDIFFISCSTDTYDMLESDCMELTLKDGDIKFDAWVV